MSLRVDYKNVEDKSSFEDDDGVRNDDYTFSIGCLLLSAGMNEVTEDNFGEFFARVFIWEKINGAFFRSSGEALPFNEGRARKLIGVHVNYGKDDTRNQWLKRIISAKMDDIKVGRI